MNKVAEQKNIQKPTTGIAVDGYCKGNPGPGGYKIVDIATGEIVKEKHFGYHVTNNIAEFLGLVDALGMVKKDLIKGTVYTDSEIAMSWVKNKGCTSNFDINSNAVLKERIWKCEMFLVECKKPLFFKKWETKHWGEVPADFGHKK
jgi:ribonuclease HI